MDNSGTTHHFTHGGLNTLRPRQMDTLFQTTFANGFSWMKMYEFPLKFHWSLFVPRGPISNIPTLVEIMAWHLPGDKPLSQPMIVSLLTNICVTRPQWVNSLNPERFGWNLDRVFKLISMINGWGIYCQIALRWMSLDLTDNKSSLFQVMAWCRRATSDYLRQYWARSMSPYGVIRPQWIKKIAAILQMALQIYFLERKLFYFDSNFTEIFPLYKSIKWQ